VNELSGQALLERESELAAIDALLEGLADGSGAVLVLEGEAGIGKTALLRACCERARTRGARVLAARGGELEREFAFGMARQLFEPVVDPGATEGPEARVAAGLGLADQGAPSGGDAGRAFELVHGLFWLAAREADRTPLLLAVDDAQWGDSESLRLLVYLARRIGELPIALVVAARHGEAGVAEPLLAALRAEPGVVELAPGPLGPAAVASMVAGVLGGSPDPAFVQACLEVTGGNPFLLGALLDDLAGQRLRPTAEHVERVLGASPVSVQRSALVRLAQLGPDPLALAQAVAILERDAEPADAAALAGLTGERARAATDALVAARVLDDARPLRFVHPLLQSVVYSDMGLARRAEGHRRAASLCDVRAPDRALGHLLASHPAGDAWVLERLRAGAARALARGSLDAARALLERALAEAPDETERARTLAAIGHVERLAGLPEAGRRLEAALAITQDPDQRAKIARELLDVYLQRGDDARARELIADAREQLPDPGGTSWLELEATLVAFMQLRASPEEAERLADRLAERLRRDGGETGAERRLAALLAFHRFIHAQTKAAEVEDLVVRAIAAGLVEEEGAGHPVALAALSVLMGLERVDEVAGRLAAAEQSARRRGAVLDLAGVLLQRARLAFFLGDLRGAEADARAALEFAEPAGLRRAAESAAATLVVALVESGRLADAEAELVARSFPSERSGTWFLLLHARAQLRRAQRRPAEAATDLLEAHLHRAPAGGSLFTQPLLAEALHEAGHTRPARELSSEALARAERWGVPGPLGVALRVHGLVEGGETGIAALERAVTVLARSPRRLEQARALVDLGAARRRANDRAAAREPLADGMEQAHRCGAEPLALRAREELVACGARPRRLVRRGVDALTPSELRVARLVAQGATNREAAQALWISRKTVETHLAAIYRKLGVNDRALLADALGARAQPRSASLRG
jgi:DNA-binding CsgD family transcriptional regulator/tetratricopeptide (TPR) repeat protein